VCRGSVRTTLGEAHPHRTSRARNLSALLMQQGKLQAAEALLREARQWQP
jgi:hypothetical protein